VLAVFTASGFAGLIYESIWSHYLKLFLGHAAYAQTLVLAIFMGGMAIGAWAASRLSPRLRDLLLAYALIEAAIGIASLFFHEVFVAMTAMAFDHVIPTLGSPGAVQAFKWSVAAALILPQSVLLGATFPLLTGGVLRVQPERAGYVVAMLYFTNSLGAAAGVLASGFYFIAAAGLPGTLVAAGVVNLAVALAAFVIRPRAKHAVAPAPAPTAGPSVPHLKMLLAVAALTGASSFMYEIGWIRMLSLVLGSSTHAFELMLSAFILGIAFGGLAIRRRIDAAANPLHLLGWVQVAMGVAALATLPVYSSTFRVMETAMKALTATESGYVAFHFVSHAICLAVMFPAAFCAGMTLPLITAALLRKGAGERAIGQVYAANTAGAIVGVFVAVHIGMVLLGLKGLIVAGAAIDLALGVVLLGSGTGGRRRTYASAAIATVAVVAALVGVQLDAHRMASGVFRSGILLRAGGTEQAVLQLDGKTATVSVTESRGGVALRTNGKSDGAIRLGEGAPYDDELMMTLLGTLPQVFAPEATQVANIGFGTGLSAHVLLASRRIELLDTVEIEPAIVQAAARFRPRNARALDDPRSHLHFDDAKTYFSAGQRRYDVIVSEPSNPWVSGVSGLFSVEFYGEVRRYLRDGGLFLQWVHVYEMTPALVATIVTALAGNFEDFEIWMPNHGDLIIVAVHKGKLPRPDAGALLNPLLRAELERFNIRNLDDLLVHRVAGRAALAPYYGAFGVRPNSDYAPVLDLNAGLARFLRQQADDLPRLLEAPIPVLALFDRPRSQQPDPARFSAGAHPWLRRAERAKQAELAAAYLRGGRPAILDLLPATLAADLALLRAGLVDCRIDISTATARRALMEVAGLVNGNLPQPVRTSLWRGLESSTCAGVGAARPWLSLHAAIANEDATRIAASADALLQGELSADLAPYAVAAHMTGLLLGNDGPGAMRSFQAHRHELGAGGDAWSPVFRFLVGQTGGG
jgi:predicted membrane-bound spermidine synthase